MQMLDARHAEAGTVIPADEACLSGGIQLGPVKAEFEGLFVALFAVIHGRFAPSGPKHGKYPVIVQNTRCFIERKYHRVGFADQQVVKRGRPDGQAHAAACDLSQLRNAEPAALSAQFRVFAFEKAPDHSNPTVSPPNHLGQSRETADAVQTLKPHQKFGNVLVTP
ncbi:MAG: hypothetical protein AAFY25_05815 [Pseudomonadota bacterium]